jgi:hypothetical protein
MEPSIKCNKRETFNKYFASYRTKIGNIECPEKEKEPHSLMQDLIRASQLKLSETFFFCAYAFLRSGEHNISRDLNSYKYHTANFWTWCDCTRVFIILHRNWISNLYALCVQESIYQTSAYVNAVYTGLTTVQHSQTAFRSLPRLGTLDRVFR